MILAIDFDNTLRSLDNGLPMQDAAKHMGYLKKNNHFLIIHSVRNNSNIIRDWLDLYGIPYDDITNLKPNADAYIDDKAIRFTTWEDTMKQLEVLHA